ncbi:hypothetical protein [Paracoccus sp. (in: a-proteobacteria)]|uniref:hypothetical protein n=1 Tax=Paracoccus sp. TaxID=267 RepID=UPI0026E04427|nr:hypothetical protein [Paracoccus sp. (in: a-proteobacteria)]MDO5648867.1 hypothetical protein [Paracoccus sp. (in: a-proteobacteria)]
MSYPLWPAGLTQFERQGWQAQAQDSRRKRQADAGPPSFRRRFSSAARRVSLSLIASRDQKAVFDRFYDDECANGSTLFWMPDPATDGWPVLGNDGLRLLTGDGQLLLMAARWLCAWGDEPPVETIQGDTDFRIAFSVWVMP